MPLLCKRGLFDFKKNIINRTQVSNKIIGRLLVQISHGINCIVVTGSELPGNEKRKQTI